MKRRDKNSNLRTGILICGAYGLGNTGDEAILTAILQEVRAAAPGAEITVLSRDPRETNRLNGVRSLFMFDLPGIWKTLRRCRLYINGGGSLIQDATSRRSLWYYLYTLRAAKRRGCRVLMYGCGIGPVTNRQDRRFTRRVLNRYVDRITLRDADSLRELEELGVTAPEIILAADPALTLRPAPAQDVDRLFQKAGVPPTGRYICFALRYWKGFREKAPVFTAAARYAWERYGLTPVFTAVETRQDPSANRLAAEGLREAGVPCCFVDDPGGAGTIIGLLNRMEIVVSMRLHALIFAAGQGVPLVGAVYDPKVSAFLRYLGQELFLDLDALTEEKLTGLIDRAAEQSRHPEERRENARRLRIAENKNSESIQFLWNM